MFNKIKNNFLTGLVVMLPLILTIAVLAFLTRKINENILAPIINLLGLRLVNPFWIFVAKTLGFLIIILLTSLIGSATRLILIRNFFGFWERLLSKVPMIGKIYVAIKEISGAFLGQGKEAFEKVVLLDWPRKGLYTLGFITGHGNREIQEKTNTDIVHVFIPTCPNPTTGFFIAVPKQDVLPLEMSVADAFKLIVSGGAVSPRDKK